MPMPHLNQTPFIKITRAVTILAMLSFGCAKKTSPPIVDSKPQQSSSDTQPTTSSAPKGIEVITLYTSHDDKIGDTKILISRPVGDSTKYDFVATFLLLNAKNKFQSETSFKTSLFCKDKYYISSYIRQIVTYKDGKPVTSAESNVGTPSAELHQPLSAAPPFFADICAGKYSPKQSKDSVATQQL